MSLSPERTGGVSVADRGRRDDGRGVAEALGPFAPVRPEVERFAPGLFGLAERFLATGAAAGSGAGGSGCMARGSNMHSVHVAHGEGMP